VPKRKKINKIMEKNMSDILKVFIGFDHRQPVSYNVLQQSIFARSSQPVSITPLVINQLPIKRVGLTPFTFSRFLVPYLCSYKGWALFLDIDILLQADISKLFELADNQYAIMVSKNKIKFEWASVMLFNCAKCTILTPEFIDVESAQKNIGLHTIEWAKSEEIGDLPREWNHLVGYDSPRSDAKLIHYTQGVPCFPKTKGSEYAKEWYEMLQIVNHANSWEELMGNSVHAVELQNGERVPRYYLNQPKEANHG
jgi:lipopolysaccharide biosynthesis glycosyltransferase